MCVDKSHVVARCRNLFTANSKKRKTLTAESEVKVDKYFTFSSSK